ncbi:MAG: lipid-A-disaccharide synthase [Gammaproteobacteria bacterium]|nr:lipid-A-disaccharide synthase [Gammaproteobacteria bacterium]
MKIGLVAGEASGDLLGAGLMRELRALAPQVSFEGVAGPAMLDEGCAQWYPADTLAVMGLVEPLAHIPRLLRLRKELLKRWQASPPDVFVGIDAPDFNLGLETKLRRSGIKTVHYVSPSVWAWRAGRIKKVARAADTLLCILPFEKRLYAGYDVNAVFVGHPKADQAPPVGEVEPARQQLGLDASTVVAVLPGSRSGEVARLGMILAEAAKLLSDSHPGIRFVTPIAAPALRPAIERQLAEAGVADRFLLVEGDSQTAMMAADVVLLASGTAALESALLGKPTVAVYRLAPASYALVKALRLIKLEHYTLPNLLTDAALVPEFIQGAAKPEAVAAAVGGLLDDPQRRRFISDEFAKLKVELALNADQRAAAAIFELARQPR